MLQNYVCNLVQAQGERKSAGHNSEYFSATPLQLRDETLRLRGEEHVQTTAFIDRVATTVELPAPVVAAIFATNPISDAFGGPLVGPWSGPKITPKNYVWQLSKTATTFAVLARTGDIIHSASGATVAEVCSIFRIVPSSGPAPAAAQPTPEHLLTKTTETAWCCAVMRAFGWESTTHLDDVRAIAEAAETTGDEMAQRTQRAIRTIQTVEMELTDREIYHSLRALLDHCLALCRHHATDFWHWLDVASQGWQPLWDVEISDETRLNVITSLEQLVVDGKQPSDLTFCASDLLPLVRETHKSKAKPNSKTRRSATTRKRDRYRRLINRGLHSLLELGVLQRANDWKSGQTAFYRINPTAISEGKLLLPKAPEPAPEPEKLKNPKSLRIEATLAEGTSPKLTGFWRNQTVSLGNETSMVVIGEYCNFDSKLELTGLVQVDSSGPVVDVLGPASFLAGNWVRCRVVVSANDVLVEPGHHRAGNPFRLNLKAKGNVENRKAWVERGEATEMSADELAKLGNLSPLIAKIHAGHMGRELQRERTQVAIASIDDMLIGGVPADEVASILGNKFPRISEEQITAAVENWVTGGDGRQFRRLAKLQREAEESATKAKRQQKRRAITVVKTLVEGWIRTSLATPQRCIEWAEEQGVRFTKQTKTRFPLANAQVEALLQVQLEEALIGRSRAGIPF